MKEPDSFYKERLRNKFDVQVNISQEDQQKLITKRAYTLKYAITHKIMAHRCSIFYVK